VDPNNQKDKGSKYKKKDLLAKILIGGRVLLLYIKSKGALKQNSGGAPG
jgi:hypothetical protein